MEENFENIAKQVVDAVQRGNKETGNCITETTKVIRILFPNGIPSGKEQDEAIIVRILDKMFRIANAQGNTSAIWQELTAYALNASKQSV